MADYNEIHKDIVAKCLKGDKTAYRKLYKLYNKAMYNISFRLLNNREEAEDVLQEAFLAAFTRLNEFRYESSFGAWLKKIVVFKTVDAMRKRKPQFEFVDEINPNIYFDSDNSDWEPESALWVQRIKNAMNRLPEGSKTVFSLYLIEGFDHVEIAEIMNISESTSKSQFLRAKQRIRELLKEYEYEKG